MEVDLIGPAAVREQVALPLCERETLPPPRRGSAIRLLRGCVGAFGHRRGGRALKVVSDAAEAYNDWIHFELDEPRRQAWLERDLRRLLRASRERAREEEPLLRRVFDRLGEAPDARADAPIVESVAFARVLVALGVVLGAADDAAHALLDRYALGLGILWELGHGPVDRGAISQALADVGIHGAEHADLPLLAWSLVTPAIEAAKDPRAAGELLVVADEARRRHGSARRARRYAVCAPTMGAPKRAPLGRSYAQVLSELALPGLAPALGDAFDRELGELVSAQSPSIRSALDFLQRQGGKRVRPTLVLLGAQASGGDARRAIRLACLVEWLHQASLVLDDMLDEAPLRRGLSTLHVATTAPFSTLVVGFILRAVARAAEAEPDAVQRAIVDAAATLADGERLELAKGGRAITRTEYMHIIEAKTARLFSCSAALGALSAGASPPTVKALGAFGREAGIAFQIVDDTLDYVGDERDLGKRPGTDHAARKVTLPLLLLSEHAGGDPRALLDRPLPWLRDRLAHSGTAQACLDVARRHLDLARAKLLHLPDSGALLSFANRLVERRS